MDYLPSLNHTEKSAPVLKEKSAAKNPLPHPPSLDLTPVSSPPLKRYKVQVASKELMSKSISTSIGNKDTLLPLLSPKSPSLEKQLEKAVKQGHFERAQTLLQQNPTFNLNSKNASGKTLLMQAAIQGNLPLFELFLKGRASTQERDQNGFTALHYAAENGHAPLIALLPAKDPSLDIQDHTGYTALMIASEADQLDAVQLLVQKGSALNSRDENGYTPLLFAIASDNLAIAKHLLKAGADCNVEAEEGETALTLAIQEGSLEMLALLSEQADLNFKNSKQKTALMTAILSGKNQAARMLIEKGADLELQDRQGYSALMLAVKKRNREMVQVLLEHGADTRHQTKKEGYSALLLAKRTEQKEIAQILAKSGQVEAQNQKEFRHRKFLAHLFNFQGSTLFAGEKYDAAEKKWEEHRLLISLETFYSIKPWWKKIAKGTEAFAKLPSHPLSQQSREDIATMSHSMIEPLGSIADHLQKEKPLALATGYRGHAATVFIWRGFFILCDRGGASRAPLQIYQIPNEQIKEKAFGKKLEKAAKEMESLLEKSAENYRTYFSKTLPSLLNLKQGPLEKELQKNVLLSQQKVGNCSWASAEGAIYAYFMMQSYFDLEQKEQDLNRENNVQEAILNGALLFEQWLTFQKIHHLEKYVELHDPDRAPIADKRPAIDQALVKKALKQIASLMRQPVMQEKKELLAQFKQLQNICSEVL